MLSPQNSTRRNLRSRRRRGVILVESALIYSVTLFLLLGTVVMGLGVFQYQQIAALAREGSRWAAVHGPKYQSEQGATAISSSDVMTKAILPRVVVLNTSALTCNLTMTGGKATVSLSYNWTPEAFFAPITMNSTSVTPVLY